jgi:hypothetical protein
MPNVKQLEQDLDKARRDMTSASPHDDRAQDTAKHAMAAAWAALCSELDNVEMAKAERDKKVKTK